MTIQEAFKRLVKRKKRITNLKSRKILGGKESVCVCVCVLVGEKELNISNFMVGPDIDVDGSLSV